MASAFPVDPMEFLGSDAVEHVQRYFAHDGNDRSFTGAMFERLAGGGDRPEVANRITGDDVVAVSLLSVQIPARAALWLLEEGADEIGGLLASIPNGTDMWDADWSVFATGSPADSLWQRLTSVDDIGWVTANKLLARKRPRLLPVYDTVVRNALEKPTGFWRALWTDLCSDHGLRHRLAQIRGDADVGDDVSLLRVFDVAIWMAARPQSR